MSRLRQIIQEEIQGLLPSLLSTTQGRGDTPTLGKVTSADISSGKVTVVMTDGTTVQAGITGNKAVKPGSAVTVVGGMIL